jgi:hypothetical protein
LAFSNVQNAARLDEQVNPRTNREFFGFHVLDAPGFDYFGNDDFTQQLRLKPFSLAKIKGRPTILERAETRREFSRNAVELSGSNRIAKNVIEADLVSALQEANRDFARKSVIFLIPDGKTFGFDPLQVAAFSQIHETMIKDRGRVCEATDLTLMQE